MQSALANATILLIANQYSVYVGCISIGAGIIGNIINILIFTRLKFFRTNQGVFYLTIESIFDIIYQLYYLSLTIFKYLYGSDLTDSSLIKCRTKHLFGQSTALIAFCMICLAAADQFLSSSYRFHWRQICTIKLSRHLAFLTVILCVTHSILFSLAFNIVPSAGCIISHPVSIRYASVFFYPFLMGFLPIAIATSFSLLAFGNVRRIVRRQIPIERRRFDRQITAMILLRVAFFVIFLLPYVINRMYTINNITTDVDSLPFAILTLTQTITFSIFNLIFTVISFLFTQYNLY